MKFILFVEGKSEKQALSPFLKRWLDPRLPQPVKIELVDLGGWSNLVKDAEMKAVFHLKGPKKDEIIAIIGLLDLYEAQFDYPKNVSMPYEKHDWAKKYMEETVVKQAKYFQFFAVHETEAWLLSDSAIFPSEFRHALDKIKLPEAVNFDEPPAKLLHRLYRHKYRKTTHGPELFGKLNPQVAYTKCPKLKALLDKMLELAQSAMKQ